MSLIKTNDPLALKILMTEDIYRLEEVEMVTKPTSTEPEIIREPLNFNYLGENNKYFLILVKEERDEIISKANLDTLSSILTAKKMELRDVAILNYKKYPGTDFSTLKSFFACSKCVLLGINPKEITPSDIPGNKITTVDGVKILAGFSFDEMQADVNKKRIFWNEMKLL